METTTQIADQQSSPRKSSFWPERFLGPPPGLKEINLACWCLFIGFLVIPICVVHWIQVKHGEGSVVQLHSDFVYFYGDGSIASNYPAAKIYDYKLEEQVFNSIYPAHSGEYGPSPYPPFIPLFFMPFAHLSFPSAYLLWLSISLVLYVAGITSATAAIFPGDSQKLSVILCFALAFSPFLFSTLINGQLASIAVCAVGIALYQERLENPIRCGLALSLLTYKPTLLLLILPMLVLSRKFRTIAGFLSGSIILLAASTAFGGVDIWPAYIRMLRYFSRIAGIGAKSRKTLWNQIDLRSFFAALPGGRHPVGLVILSCLIAVAGIALIALLWRSARGDRATRMLAWAATLTWTTLLSVYVPIYDSVLVVIAVVLTLGALRDLKWSKAAEWTTILALVIFAVAWKTESFAKAHHIQLLTLALLVLGTAQLVFLRRAIRQELPA